MKLRTVFQVVVIVCRSILGPLVYTNMCSCPFQKENSLFVTHREVHSFCNDLYVTNCSFSIIVIARCAGTTFYLTLVKSRFMLPSLLCPFKTTRNSICLLISGARGPSSLGRISSSLGHISNARTHL